MKTIYFILILAISLFITTSCNTNDDNFYNTVYLNYPNVVIIDTPPSYQMNDYLRVKADFSRFVPEENQSTLLDIRKTTGNAAAFIFSYILEKKNSSNTWDLVIIPTNQLNIIKGDAISGSYVYGKCLYNAATEKYEYNVGVPLTAAGDYRLSFGYAFKSKNIELISDSNGSNLLLHISTTTNNLNSEGYYLFTVI